MSTLPDHDELTLFVHELGDLARSLLLQRFRSAVRVVAKDDASPVTDADRELERALRKRITDRFPTHGILGEEYGESNLDAERVWVLDPIDGTRAFMSGKPIFGCLIALVQEEVPVLGLIEAPATAERWVAASGAGAFLNGERTAVRPPRPLSEGILYTEGPRTLEGMREPRLLALREATRWVNYDLDCYMYGMLARGDVDVVVEPNLHPYDFCALVPIVQEAGGVISRWNGVAVSPFEPGNLVAASSIEVWEEARRHLAP